MSEIRSPRPIHQKTVVRDRKWLDELRTQPCLLTGRIATENEAVDPMHIGTAGKALKSDDEAIPVIHSLHMEGHGSPGEVYMLRKYAPNWLLREAFRAYARALYKEWKEGR